MMKKENFKSTFAIIHLSDLHIVSHNSNYSTSLHKMIDHIFDISHNISKVIIVFTGDLVEKGDFSSSEETIYKFFIDLFEKLKPKVIDIIFTPGNHDKKRGLLLLKELKNESDEIFWDKFKKEEWSYFPKQFKDYLDITKKIRKDIFGLTDTFSGSYGIHETRVDDFNICFICINSAWLSMDENDEGKLRIGRFQLDDLMNQYQKNKENIDLVIALMHHPTDWLTKDEQKYLNQYMTDEYRLNTNIMLQGHIHEKETYNWYNQNHSLTTLVTGMGWDQQRKINDNGHRYSLYEVNMDSSIVRVNTFVSDNSEKFNDDTEVYKGTNIIFPLFVHKYLEMNKLKFSDSEFPLFYPNYNPADNYENITVGINKFSIHMTNLIKNFQYECLSLNESILIIKEKIMLSCTDGKIEWTEELKNDIKNKYMNDEKIIMLHKLYNNIINKDFSDFVDRLFNSIETNLVLKKEITEIEIKDILDNFSKKYINIDTKDKFYSFIVDFCFELQKSIFKTEIFKDDSVLRTHFRIVNTKDDEIKYKKLFSLSVIREHGVKKLKPIEDSELSDISYEDSMIEKSFNSGHSMLFSLNPSSNKHQSNNDWIDFMTIAPKYDYNTYKIDDETEIPYISFGISVNSLDLQVYLQELAFVGFEKLLSNLLNSFFNNISFDLGILLDGGEINEYR